MFVLVLSDYPVDTAATSSRFTYYLLHNLIDFQNRIIFNLMFIQGVPVIMLQNSRVDKTHENKKKSSCEHGSGNASSGS